VELQNVKNNENRIEDVSYMPNFIQWAQKLWAADTNDKTDLTKTQKNPQKAERHIKP